MALCGNLILSRREGERIRLRMRSPDGDHTDIWLTVLEVSQYRQKVRISIEAPQTVVIEREEIIRRPN